jgi:hypothetical protein
MAKLIQTGRFKGKDHQPHEGVESRKARAQHFSRRGIFTLIARRKANTSSLVIDLLVLPRCSNSSLVRLLSTAKPATPSVHLVSVVTKRLPSTLLCAVQRPRRFSSVASRSRNTNSGSATFQQLATLDSVSANTLTWVSSMILQLVSTEWTFTSACKLQLLTLDSTDCEQDPPRCTCCNSPSFQVKSWLPTQGHTSRDCQVVQDPL